MNSLKFKIANVVRLTGLPNEVADEIQAALTIPNPKYVNAKKFRHSTYNLNSELTFYEQDLDGLRIPRGFANQAVGICRQHDLAIEFDDQRRTLPSAGIVFKGQLRDYQQEAVTAMTTRDWGILQAPTGSGKTVTALCLAAKRNQPTLIVVHTKTLLNQWIGAVEKFLGIPKDQVGTIGGGRFQIGRQITVATVQSLYNRLPEVVPHIGHLIIDECHRCPSRTFSEAVQAFDCQYMTGLSATPYRRDGLTEVIHFYLGETLHKITRQQLVEDGHIISAKVRFRSTEFCTVLDASTEYPKVISLLCKDPQRNAQIAADAAAVLENDPQATCLLLSDRREHCEALQNCLKGHGWDSALLTGAVSPKKRLAALKGVQDGHVRVIIATAQLAGEGFDLPSLSHLFICSPVKFKGRLIQCVGRVLRPAPGKERAVVYDFVDHRIGILESSARTRLAAYRRAGFEII